ncbi:GNAT family N-acetyltransferase [Nitratireductor sp. ZSWI3]|uniref:GNAT family N-acetyltransferase n=1 Tax=Nitratireductor sp. ZSWI3 TaxID=2966359 RepID=UPI00214FC4BC|nr:GNAT family N-acetyltransferase [Nitratireductor sp. ZSWI3]MCR4264867.1 acetyltransferase [Nitratireductor sp. ZSWI3]
MTAQPANRDFTRAGTLQPMQARDVTRHFPASGGHLAARLERDGILTLTGRGGETIATARLVQARDDRAALADVRLSPARADGAHLLAALVDAVFLRLPSVTSIGLPAAKQVPPVAALATESDGEVAIVRRSAFRQLPLLWRHQRAHVTYPLLRSAIGPQDRLPPLRPPRPDGLMYERWLAELGLTVSLRPIDRRSDLPLFHHWMNQGRVAYFWELAKTEEELDAYLAEQEADPHIFGVIASFDGEPTGYFEFYWAKEDRLGPYYEHEDFDRGWHGLIGNPRHLGRPKTLALFRSVTHYLFLDDPRTRRIMGEPRASHQKMLSYAADAAYEKLKEFDFPHKRAALVCCERERFFREVPL